MHQLLDTPFVKLKGLDLKTLGEGRFAVRARACACVYKCIPWLCMRACVHVRARMRRMDVHACVYICLLRAMFILLPDSFSPADFSSFRNSRGDAQARAAWHTPRALFLPRARRASRTGQAEEEGKESDCEGKAAHCRHETRYVRFRLLIIFK